MAQNHTSKRMISHQKMNVEGEAPPIVAYRRLVLVQSLFAGDIPNLVAKLALQPNSRFKESRLDSSTKWPEPKQPQNTIELFQVEKSNRDPQQSFNFTPLQGFQDSKLFTRL
jgi:hypothetical protein